MNRIDEAKAAWILWNHLFDFQDLLWKTYEPDFLDFLVNDEDPKPSGIPPSPDASP